MARLLVSHVGGVFKLPCHYLGTYLKKMYEPSAILSLKRHLTKEGDVVSIMVVGKTEGLYRPIEKAKEVIVWNPEQEGSPRFGKICADLVVAIKAKPGVEKWRMMTVGEVEFRHPDIHVCPTIFMWDVPQAPLPVKGSSLSDLPIKNEGLVGSIFLNHGRRKRFTDLLKRAIAHYQVHEGIPPRDPFLTKASVVINIHARGNPKAIELHRISRCLAMGCVVLSEGTEDRMTKEFLISAGLPVYFAPTGLTPSQFCEWVVDTLKEVGGVGKKENQAKFYSWFSSLKDHVI